MKQIAKADLVRWFEYYEDRIVRDAGLGIVVAIRHQTFMERDWTSCLVYKFKTSNTDWFDARDIDQINPPVCES
tara:strand:+ start:34 stop:255 length:222 start_codon:yes stop_codon:yes gene_type:complete